MTATVAHTKFYAGTTKPCASASDYASDTWTEVTGLTDLGEIGDTADEIKVNIIGEARVRKYAGTQDAGDFTLTAVRDNSDPGQATMNANATGGVTINFKAQTLDGVVTYFAGIILQAQTKFGQANSVVERMWKIAVSVQPIEV